MLKERKKKIKSKIKFIKSKYQTNIDEEKWKKNYKATTIKENSI